MSRAALIALLAVLWLVTVTLLWHAAGCSVQTPC